MKQVKEKNNEKGVAFVVLLIVIFFLSMISISYLFMSRTQQGKSYKQEQAITALSTAEAGLDRAIWYLIKKAEGDLPDWSAPTPGYPVNISESLSKKSAFTAEIQCVSAPGGGGGLSLLPPRATPNTWYVHPRSANLPHVKGSAAAITINGIVFMFGGYGNPQKNYSLPGDASSDIKDDFNYWGYYATISSDKVMLAYDPKTDTWTDLGAPPAEITNKSKYAAVQYNNKMYMFGRDPNVVLYNPGSNLLSSSDDTWQNVANMQTQFTEAPDRSYTVSAAVVGDKIYVLGGYYRFPVGGVQPGSEWGIVSYSSSENRWYSYGTVLKFDPATNQFSKMNPLPDGRYYGDAAALGDKIYCIGGLAKTGMYMGIDPVTGEGITTSSGGSSRTMWKYDPNADGGKGTVTVGPHVPWLQDDPNTPCPEHLKPWGGGDKVTGETESKSLKTHVRDPEYGGGNYGMTYGVDFSTHPGLDDHHLVVVDDKLYLVGGSNGLLRTYQDAGPGYWYDKNGNKKEEKSEWQGTYIDHSTTNPNEAVHSNTTEEDTILRDLYYDYQNGTAYGTYQSYRDWQGIGSSYYRWTNKLYEFNGTSWRELDHAPSMDMETKGGVQGVGIANHALAAVDGRFYTLGGISYHYRDPGKTYDSYKNNPYIVEGDDTKKGYASAAYVNGMYLSVAEFYIKPEQTGGSDEGIYKIISTGSETIGFLGKTTQRRIEALVKIKPMTGANGFDGSIICKSGITGVGNATTDSYDSDKGAYGPGNNGQEGNIFSNGNISLVGNSLVDGDAHYGPDDNISFTGQATVTGDKGALGQEISLSSITVPSGAIDKGEINNDLTLTTGTYTCSGINLSGQETLTINGEVKLYCTGNIQISGQGSIDNSNGNATDFHIYCTDAVTSVDVVGNGEFFGTIYAPTAEIKVSGNGNVYGQLVGNTVKFNGNGAVIYDEQLKNTLWWPKEKKTRDIIYWREVGL